MILEAIKDKEFLARFWAKVDQDSGCWRWTGCRDAHGYGGIRYKGEMLKAHRVSLVLRSGDIGDLHALHSCDNRACVNPNHVWSTDLELSLRILERHL